MTLREIEQPAGLGGQNAIGWKSDVAAEMLRRIEVPYIALNPGASYRGFHDSLVNYLGNSSPRMLLCLHEDHVVSIAHGYAKALDEPMACVLHSNVGLMHGLMGIFNAWCDRVPMIVVGATGPVQMEKRRPWIDWIHTAKDQGALLRHYTKWDDEPRSWEGIVEAFLRGNQMTATTPRAPVYICLDAGLQEEPAPAAIQIPDVERYQPPHPASAAPEDVKSVSERLCAARNPLFLMGRGSRDQAAWDRRVQLVERTGAMVMTSVRERAIFPTDHERHVVPPLAWLDPDARSVFEMADFVVSLDWVDLNGILKQAHRQPSELAAGLVHVTQDRSLHNGWSMDYFGLPPADLNVDADPDAFVSQLLMALEEIPERGPSWSGVSRGRFELPAYGKNADSQIVPFDIEIALAELKARRAVALAHTNIGWSGRAYQLTGPLDYLGHDGGGGLAAGPGLTVGAALALKDIDRTVVSVLGDGDFLQGVTALWTAAHYGIPALFIVANNRSNFNDEVHQDAVAKMRSRPPENRWIGQRIDDPAVDLAAMARAQGVEAEGPVGNVPDLLAAIERGLAVVDAGQPYLIDAHVVPGYTKKIMTRGDE